MPQYLSLLLPPPSSCVEQLADIMASDSPVARPDAKKKKEAMLRLLGGIQKGARTKGTAAVKTPAAAAATRRARGKRGVR